MKALPLSIALLAALAFLYACGTNQTSPATEPGDPLIAARDKLPSITVVGNPGRAAEMDNIPDLDANGKPILNADGKPRTHRAEISACWRLDETVDDRVYALIFPTDVTSRPEFTSFVEVTGGVEPLPPDYVKNHPIVAKQTPLPGYLLYVRTVKQVPPPQHK